MTPYEAIVSKRDIRHYTDEPVADEAMRRVLQAGRMAGSAKNMEVNRLIVCRDRVVKDALARAGDYAGWISRAPVVIGIAAPVDDHRMFDVGRMAQNMMVAANAEGLATCPVSLHRQADVRAAVGLPDDWGMRMVVTVGHPDPDAPPSPLKRPRVALDDLVSHDRWA
ncbi:MAG: nitroreductase family protein [Acidimicrobiales bacterium]